MPLPGVDITIQDGALGIAAADNSQNCASLGVCSAGIPNTLYAFTQPSNVRSILGYGPLAEAVALKLAVAGGIQYAMPVTPAYDSAASSVTFVGSGACRVTVSAAPLQTITLTCSTTGALATAQFTYRLGTGTTSAPVTSAAGWSSTGYIVPGTMTKLVFTEGGGATKFEVGDVFTIATTGGVTVVRAGTSSGTVAQTSQYVDDYVVRVLCTTTGVPGTGQFRWSVDGGNAETDGGTGVGSYSAATLIPTGFAYAIPNTGIVLTFSNASSTAGDLSSFNTIASDFSNANLTTAFTTLLALPYTWGFAHAVGKSATGAAAATRAGIVSTAMSSAQTAYRYTSAFSSTPTNGTIVLDTGAPVAYAAANTAVVTDFAAFESTRTDVGAGDFLCLSPLTGYYQRRSADYISAARGCAAPPAEDIGWVGKGSLSGWVRSLYYDEAQSAVLDAGRFVTLRSFQGRAGYFITNGNTMAQTTSDFHRWANRRVMDVACATAYDALVDYVNDNVLVDPATGFILESEAQSIEADVLAPLKAALVDRGQASAVSVVVSRTANILSTSELPVTIKVTPLGYLSTIEVTIGFSNPAIAAAAA